MPADRRELLRRWRRFSHAFHHPYPPVWVARWPFGGFPLLLAILLWFFAGLPLHRETAGVSVAVPVSATPLAALGAPAGWEVEVGGEVEITMRPGFYLITAGPSWETLVDPKVGGPVNPPAAVVKAAPPASEYIAEAARRLGKPADASGWGGAIGWWRFVPAPPGERGKLHLAAGMVLSGRRQSIALCLWQLPILLTTIVVTLIPLLQLRARMVRAARRERAERMGAAFSRERCPECGYSIAGLRGTCPECGWEFASRVRRLAAMRGRYRAPRAR